MEVFFLIVKVVTYKKDVLSCEAKGLLSVLNMLRRGQKRLKLSFIGRLTLLIDLISAVSFQEKP